MPKTAAKDKVATQFAKTTPQPPRPPLVSNKPRKGVNTSNIPPKLLDDAAEEWLDQLTSVFERKSALAHMPLYEDQYPCPSVLVVNYGKVDHSASEPTQVNHWFYPCGAGMNPMTGAQNSKPLQAITQRVLGGGLAKFGAVLRPENVATIPACGLYGYITPGGSGPVDKPITAVPPNPSTLSPLSYELLDTPFLSGGNGLPGRDGNGLEFRTAAFGVRVTYISRLMDTEGFVEHYAPAEYPEEVNSNLSARDTAWRINYFGAKRSYCFYWTPNCDEIVYSQDNHDNLIAPDIGASTRFAIKLGGLNAGDVVRVEWMCIQEWTGHKAIPVQIPRTLTADVTHIVNALTLHRGSQHDEKDIAGNMRKGQSLKMITSGVKVLSHPMLRRAINAAPGVMKDIGEVVGAVKSAGKVLLGLLG